jgi:hypothetical protein
MPNDTSKIYDIFTFSSTIKYFISALNKSNLMLGGLCSSKIELLFYTNDDYIKKLIFANLV